MKAYIFNFFSVVLFGIASIALILSSSWGVKFDVFRGIALTVCVFLFFLFWWASTVPMNHFNISTLPNDLLEEENVGGMLKIGASPIDVVIVFAYGKGEKMNATLGAWANNIVDAFGSPIGTNVYTQFDMAPFLKTIEGVSFAYEGSKYLSTYGIVKQFSEAVKGHGYYKVAVIAAPQHMKRCLRDLYAEGFKCYVDSNNKFFLPKGVSLDDESFWYNQDDPQKYVRSPKNWWKRERILRMLPFVLYKILAR